MKFELSTALIGALVLALVLVVCYMVLALEPGKGAERRAPASGQNAKSQFVGDIHLTSRSACDDPWLAAHRSECWGFPTGEMPAISVDPWGSEHRECRECRGCRYQRPPFARGTFAAPCGPAQ